MPEMTSPDGRDTLTIPDDGVAPMRALGWSVQSGASNPGKAEPKAEPEVEGAHTAEPTKRGPGRPRKHPRPED